FITHFGAYTPPTPHLTELADNLEMASAAVKASLEREGTDAERERWFADDVRARLTRRSGERDAHAYEVAGRFDVNWRGLARYWRKGPGPYPGGGPQAAGRALAGGTATAGSRDRQPTGRALAAATPAASRTGARRVR